MLTPFNCFNCAIAAHAASYVRDMSPMLANYSGAKGEFERLREAAHKVSVKGAFAEE
jgi:hypothetical protein